MAGTREVREFSAERRQRESWRQDKTLPSWAVEVLSGLAELRSEVAALRRQARPSVAPGDGQGDDAGLAYEARDVRLEIAQMVRTIGRAKTEIAAIKHPYAEDDRIMAAAGELDAIVVATETATEDILGAAEKIESLAEQLREQNADIEEVVVASDHLANEATKIFQACNFQDITGQRTQKVVKTLRFIEGRILAMIEIWGRQAFEDLPVEPLDGEDTGNLMNGPQLDDQGLTQADIDALMA